MTDNDIFNLEIERMGFAKLWIQNNFDFFFLPADADRQVYFLYSEAILGAK